MARRKIKYYSAKRRAIYAAGEDIEPLAVFERDNWTCGICKESIDQRLRKPHPRCATLDHVVEICVALEQNWPVQMIHTHQNIQAAHLSCNLEKSQSPVVHLDSAQDDAT